MKLTNPTTEIFIPDGKTEDQALARTTHMGIGAHQDDLEFMALHGILECFQKKDRWFTGIIVTDGAGSARANEYASYTDEQMRLVRRDEQKKAAFVGEYGAMVSLNYSSAGIKNSVCRSLIDDLKAVITVTQPEFIYTHNLADKHDTHIAVVLSVIQAIRELPVSAKPKALYGCEVWRSLDWMVDVDKIVFDVSARENLSMALMGLFDSQISGGKRYDLATFGRKKTNATFHSSHSTDLSRLSEYAMDLTPLIQNPSLDIKEFVHAHLDRFSADVLERLSKGLGN